MPLAFESISHGTLAFGFFNIDSDMLLLDRYFFFSTEFCDHITDIAAWESDGVRQFPWEVYHIVEPERIGDLMGAIHGIRFTGFIGEVYKKYPFPQEAADFKQKPEGTQTRAVVEEIIQAYATRTQVLFMTDGPQNEAAIGPYRFSRESFQALIRYVWEGGYPRWRDEQPPDYVLAMRDRIHESHCTLLRGLELSL